MNKKKHECDTKKAHSALTITPIQHSTLHIINHSPTAKKSVSICCAGGAICVLTLHSAWHLCKSARSVGKYKTSRLFFSADGA